jgi:orotate phosphoribosyltransferase
MTDDLLRLFVERGALLEGHFLLSSGLHSPRYLQSARVLMDPPLATRLGAELADRVRPDLEGRAATAVVSPALGGLIIGQEVARGLGALALFTEREAGRMTLRRGFHLAAGDTVVVVEDVVTTGGSTREVIEAVRARGAEVVAAAALVYRGAGPAELPLPRPLRWLLRVEAPTYAGESCPLCANGSVAVKPGSR